MKAAGTLIPILFLAIITVAVWYISRRSAWMFNIRPLWCYIFFAILTFCSFSAVLGYGSSSTSGEFMHYVTVTLCYICGILIILLLALLFTDLVNLIYPLSKRIFASSTIVLTTIVALYGFLHAANPKLKSVEIELPKLSEEISAIQLSDIHLGHFRSGAHLQKIVDIVNSTDAKIVLITGDLFDSHYNLSPATLEPFKSLKIPAFFVDGNHDGYTEIKRIKQMVADCGVAVLNNQAVECCGVEITGFAMPPITSATMHAVQGDSIIRGYLDSVELSKELPSIVLHHSPVGAEHIAKAGADLYLSGHTHGGQFFPMTLFNSYFFDYNRGLYRLGNLQIYVSEGSGTFGIPMRFGTDSEITLLKLKPKQ